MLRSLFGLVLLACLFLLPAPPAPAQFGEPVEILKNGGFEAGFEHWSTMPGHTLVEDGESHRGRRCAMGEATAPRQALKLIQNVPLKQGDLYRLSCWAKATNRAKLVIFGTFPGENQRRMIATFENVPNQWRRYETLVDAPEVDGNLQLEVICPSSFAAPLGMLWVDDISLLETDMPTFVELFPKDPGYQDLPVAMASSVMDDQFYVAWTSFRETGQRADAPYWSEHLMLGRFGSASTALLVKEVGSLSSLHGELGIFAPRMSGRPDQNGVWLAYAAETDGQGQSTAVVRAGPPATPHRIFPELQFPRVQHPSVAFQAAGPGMQAVWAAAEVIDNDGYHRIAVASSHASLPEPMLISPAGCNSYEPAIALRWRRRHVWDDQRQAWTRFMDFDVVVVYHSFRDGNYDIFLRSHWLPTRYARQ